MSASSPFQRDDEKSIWLFAGMFALSLIAHVVGVYELPSRAVVAERNRRVEMEFYEPPKPPPPPPEEPKKEEPKPLEPPKVKLKPIVKADAPPPPKNEPPPPNQEPPPETPQKPVPIVVGISMSSTTAAGGFAVQVGNTTYGKASDKVVDAADVKPYSAPKYAPPGGADTEPVVVAEYKEAYPAEAKQNDVEGSVRLKVTIDPTGKVENVVIISGPGFGLNEAARDWIRKSKFKPATRGGEPVGYTFIYTYTFLLD
ncbi:MAG: energy transducer TonB [Myxococcota bacterium]